jgi:flavin-dependent dehydrogenase
MEDNLMVEVSNALDGQLARTIWDVIVIGGGPAGALAARQAALAGLATLLIDAKDFPREKVCGGYLSSRAISVLHRTGLSQVLSNDRESHASEIELICGRQHVRLPLPLGRVVDRAAFDASLVERAHVAGAAVLTKWKALIDPMFCDDFRTVTVLREGTRETLLTRVVICADGLSRTSVRQLLEFARCATPDSRVGIGTAITVNENTLPANQITMAVSSHGYVGISRISHDRFNVAAAIDPAVIAQASPAKIAADILENAGIRVTPALTRVRWRGTPPLSSRPLHVSSERIFLIGDAAGYVEPFTGEGMATAFESAVAVMPLVIEAASSWDPSLARRWDTLHRQIVRDRQFTCKQLAWILRRPWAAFAALGMCRMLPALAHRVIAKVTVPSTLCTSRGVGPS